METALEPYAEAGSASLISPAVLSAVPAGSVSADPYLTYIASLDSPASRKIMTGNLDRIAQIVAAGGEPPPPGFPRVSGQGRSWWLLRYEHTSVIRAALISEQMGYAPATVNSHLAALRRVLTECWKLGLMSTDDWMRAKDLKDAKGTREPTGRNIHDEEFTALLAACAADPNRPLGIRDAALITFLEATGARRAEASGLLIEDYDARDRFVKITGKRDKQRTVPVHKDAVPHIGRWLTLLGERKGPVFRRINKAGHVYPDALSPQGVGYVFEQRRKQAGLPPTSTHDTRRTFIGNALSAGVDIVTVADGVGHGDVNITRGYDRRRTLGLRDAFDSIPIVVPQASSEEAAS